MRVEFVGVGEAFDETLPNNSQILEWQDCRLLIDCGYAIPHALWKSHPDPEFLDAIYLSHRHADHYFGLPSVLVRFAEDERKKAITIFSPEGTKNVVQEMIDYGYQGILPKLPFEVLFQEVQTSAPTYFRNARLEFAVSSHPVKNFAIAVHAENRKFAYSGDGNFTDHTRRLYDFCSLLVHDAYAFQKEARSHGRIEEVVKMAEQMHVEKLALTHLQRGVRRTKLNEIRAFVQNSSVDVIIPEPGDVLDV